MLMNWLDHVMFWHWWILAGLLMVLELKWSAFVFLWIGFAAAAVGFLLLVFPSIPLHVQLILFGALLLVAIVGWRRYRDTPSDTRD